MVNMTRRMAGWYRAFWITDFDGFEWVMGYRYCIMRFAHTGTIRGHNNRMSIKFITSLIVSLCFSSPIFGALIHITFIE